ncbi:hypothetical protein AX760_13585 [Pararhizobium antarcticum]|uniref:Uncharacterized protein n=1 Tax=Pararhizobium antarcticum TaxID=1798805 RepID=A0A657LWQ3_9HYPH|nr:hypothetical protein AX760_13585 [Pararhizobium antarcticum]
MIVCFKAVFAEGIEAGHVDPDAKRPRFYNKSRSTWIMVSQTGKHELARRAEEPSFSHMLIGVKMWSRASIVPLDNHRHSHVADGVQNDCVKSRHQATRDRHIAIVVREVGMTFVAQINLEVVGKETAPIDNPKRR